MWGTHGMLRNKVSLDIVSCHNLVVMQTEVSWRSRPAYWKTEIVFCMAEMLFRTSRIKTLMGFHFHFAFMHLLNHTLVNHTKVWFSKRIKAFTLFIRKCTFTVVTWHSMIHTFVRIPSSRWFFCRTCWSASWIFCWSFSIFTFSWSHERSKYKWS